MNCIIEGFFGPTWSHEFRINNANFMKQHDMSLYIYAPKAEPFLRKRWQEEFPQQRMNELLELNQAYRSNGVRFGVGLSPFELHSNWTESNRQLLKKKLSEINQLDIDVLGLFLDDMKGSPDVAEKQLEMLSFIRDHSQCQILFCPTYYSDDPILDRVFNERPKNYFERISTMPKDIEILWTGPKVLSDQISTDHLIEVSERLSRKPFIWDNLFANDGPKNYKFLKLQPIEHRDIGAQKHTSGWAQNPMNQEYLSQLAILYFLNHYGGSNRPWDLALERLCSEKLSYWIDKNRIILHEKGLDNISETAKPSLICELQAFDEPIAQEIIRWLKNDYLVGNECLTD